MSTQLSRIVAAPSSRPASLGVGPRPRRASSGGRTSGSSASWSLSAEQIERLEAIYQSTGPTMRAQKAALDKLQADLSKVVADGTADEAAAAEVIGRVEAARVGLGRTRAVMLYRMRRILTSDQHVKLKVLFDERERDRHGRGQARAADRFRFQDDHETVDRFRGSGRCAPCSSLPPRSRADAGRRPRGDRARRRWPASTAERDRWRSRPGAGGSASSDPGAAARPAPRRGRRTGAGAEPRHRRRAAEPAGDRLPDRRPADAYRPLASSSLGQRSQVNPPTNQLNGGQRVTNDTTTYNFGVAQEVPWGGGNFT